jgi:hypothetical protein
MAFEISVLKSLVSGLQNEILRVDSNRHMMDRTQDGNEGATTDDRSCELALGLD